MDTKLPPELIQELFSYCDNFTLIQLSLTSKTFHELALDAVFRGNGNFQISSGCMTVRNGSPELILAARLALFLKDLQKLHYSFNPPLNRIMDEVNGLRKLVKRLSTVHVAKLDFSVVDQSPSLPTTGIPMDIWYEAFMGLCEDLVGKGCTELRVFGAHGFLARHFPSQSQPEAPATPTRSTKFPPLFDPLHRRTTEISQFLGSIYNKPYGARKRQQKLTKCLFGDKSSGSDLQAADVHAASRLQALYLDSTMLVQAPFLERTKLLVQGSASTLTALVFTCRTSPGPQWDSWIATLKLPHLTKFVVFLQQAPPAEQAPGFGEILTFLRQHPTIEVLQLHNLGAASVLRSPVPDSILPRLATLAAGPHTICSFLKSRMQNAPPSPTPTSFVIMAGRHALGDTPFDYNSIDEALYLIPSITRRVSLAVEFTSISNVSKVISWLQQHINWETDAPSPARTRPCPIRSLKNVDSFGFGGTPFDASLVPVQMLRILPTWLGLFPDLAFFTVNAPLNNMKQLMEDVDFVGRLADHCKKLRGFECGGTLLDIATIRRAREALVKREI